MATAKKGNKKPRPSAKDDAQKKVRKNKNAIQNKNHKDNSDIYGVIVITCCLLFMFSLYSNKLGYLSIASKKIFISLFGAAAFLIPIYVLYIAIKVYFLKGKVNLSRKYWGIAGLIIVTLILMQTLNMGQFYVEGNLSASFDRIIESKSYMHGGIVTFLLILPIYKLIGSIGLYILIFSAYVICSILVFNYNIRKFITTTHNKGKDLKNKTKRKISSQVPRRNNKVNMDDTLSDRTLKDELFNRIKILDFMNNSNLEGEEDEEEIEDDLSLQDAQEIINASNKSQILEDPIFDEKKNSYEKQEDQSKVSQDIIQTLDENRQDLDLKSIEKEIEEASEPIKRSAKNTKKLDEEIKKSINTELANTIVSEDEETKQNYSYPTAELLKINTNLEMDREGKRELVKNANKLEETLLSFGVQADIVAVTKGPSVTRFEIQPKAGIKVSKIVNLSDDIALGLAAGGIRMEAPIPGKAAIGIEVPNKKQTPVYFREIIESEEFEKSNAPVACALGKDIEGKPVVTDLSAMPHLLIAGATGSGKSVCINTLIVSLLYKYSPDEVKLLMVDPKVVELSVYNGIPHLLIPVVTDPKKAAGALHWAVNEMDRRYNLFAENGARNITSYNKMVEKGILNEKLPYIVMIVDELADLMMVCPGDVEESICRLAQKARAAGMHLVIATQRPSVDVITGVIKANIPSRISFSVSSQIDSRTILDCGGAEKLLGRGDMLFRPIGKSNTTRVQGAFISEEEVEQVVDHVKTIKDTLENNYEEAIVEHMNSAAFGKTESLDDDRDELLDEAIRICVETGQASASFIQRRLRIGFNRAARIMEQLEEIGVISGKDGSKARQILISKDEIENI